MFVSFNALSVIEMSLSEVKGALSVLGKPSAIESPLKMMGNAFSKAIFVLEIFKFLSWFFGNVAKQLD